MINAKPPPTASQTTTGLSFKNSNNHCMGGSLTVDGQ